MNKRLIGTGILVAGLAALILFVLRENPDDPPDEPAPERVDGAFERDARERADSLLVVEREKLTPDDLRELESLFEPLDADRRMIEIVPLGQSVLCDVLVYDNGNIAYTFLTPTLASTGPKEAPLLTFKSETSMLHPDDRVDILMAPTVITPEGQEATLSIGIDGAVPYSMNFSGILLDGDTLSLSAEFSGSPDLPPDPDEPR